jgi:hypothetical protein
MSSQRNRWTLGLPAVVLGALLALPGFAAAAGVRYEVAPGTQVEACGGFAGGCRTYSLTGTLGLQVDPGAATAAIVESDLQLTEDGLGPYPFPTAGDLQPTGLVATEVSSERVRFESPAGSAQTADWTFLLGVGTATLDGTYDEGCCDRYLFRFEGVTLEQLEEPPQLLLGDERFAVTVAWGDFLGATGYGSPVPLTADSGYFWFFDPANVEVVVKVLNACQEPYHRFWVFAAGLTNVEVTLTVTDRRTGQERTYFNPLSTAYQPILDTNAFATCDDG